MTTTNQHRPTSTTTKQPVPRQHGRRSGFVLAALIAAGAGGYTLGNLTSQPATSLRPAVSPSAVPPDAGLDLILGRSYPAGASQILPSGNDTRDPSLEVLFGSTAIEAG